MDFGALPPEVNSTRMYTGPGSGPMIAAATAWDSLASQLRTAAASYQSVISDLVLGWRGPSSAAMAAATAPYLAWFSTTAGQVEQTATQLREATSAYETAFVATVSPAVVFANRSLLMSLIATNILGQNTAAIAATESQYAAMWAQDAAAMNAYAGSSSSARRLTPFTSPPSTTSASGSADPAAALSHSLAAANTTPSATTTSADDLTPFLVGPFNPLKLYEPFGGNFDFSFQNLLAELNRQNLQLAYDGAVDRVAKGLGPAVTYSNGQPVLAGVGQAASAGRLSVPPNWTSAAPSVKPIAFVVPQADSRLAVAAISEEGQGSMLSNMGLSGLAGRAAGAANGPMAQGAGAGRGALATEATTATIIVIPDDD